MPRTLRLRAEHSADIAEAAAILRSGGLVAFPTETVYGLGANALSAAAVQGIFAAKRRPTWDPLIVHLPDTAGLPHVATLGGEIETRMRLLESAFWPGALTLLLPRSAAILDAVTAGRAKVGVRIPSHPVAQSLLRAAGLPLAAPSANRFGHISPTTAQHVLDDLDGRIDAVLDGGPTAVGLESTVLDPGETPMLVYRAGAVTREMIERATGVAVKSFVSAQEASATPQSLPSPGVGIRHYAPDAHLILSGSSVDLLEAEIARAREGGGRIGVLLPRNWQLRDEDGLHIKPWGDWGDEPSLAAEVFGGLRALEAQGVNTIVCPLPPCGGLGDALRDRLSKASRPR